MCIRSKDIQMNTHIHSMTIYDTDADKNYMKPRMLIHDLSVGGDPLYLKF